MLIGVVSDSHDNAANLGAAIELLQQRGAAYFIHCGDVCSPDMLNHLAGLNAAFVFGNCDWDRKGLQREALHVGIACYGAMGEIELDGKKIAFTHGDDPSLVGSVIARQSHDFLFTGHTHRSHDRMEGALRMINPGALQRAPTKTAALVDLQANSVELLKIA